MKRSTRQMIKPGITRGGWSIKDVLAHLIEWQQMNLKWCATGARGEKPAMPAPGCTKHKPSGVRVEIELSEAV